MEDSPMALADEGAALEDGDGLVERETLCLPHLRRDTIVNVGERGFQETLREYFPVAESNASERLVKLKQKLRNASTPEFWRILMEEMCEITGAQAGLVGKRMVVDDQDSGVELPELGLPGSCVMAVTFYTNSQGEKQLYRDYRYPAHGTPCAHMIYDKVFIIPEKMHDFIRDSPNTLPWDRSEAFIGLPLFSEGRCFAHVALIWSVEGGTARQLSWNFIEMFMHSLEDMIVARMEDAKTFTEGILAQETAEQMIPLATTMAQSLKPHARGMSHELRTPMQGIIGMLDIMYTTVLNAITTTNNDIIRQIFEELKGNLEDVQDSSRRAVEAADNVVHAYDVNMEMPDTPTSPASIHESSNLEVSTDARPPNHTRTSSSTSLHKRWRDEDFDIGPPSKRMSPVGDRITTTENSPKGSNLTPLELGQTLLEEKSSILKLTPEILIGDKIAQNGQESTMQITSPVTTRQRINVRSTIRALVHDIIRNSHPTKNERRSNRWGEDIDMDCEGSHGELLSRTINMTFSPNVPELILVDEQYLQFCLHKLLDNAFKFTDHGTITCTMEMSRDSRILDIRIADTGCGITEESQGRLFEAHFQQDPSINRARDGLGLSLFNAKAQVRKKLRGDITLVRSSTSGPLKGSEFLMRLPVTFSINEGAAVYIVGTGTLTTKDLGLEYPTAPLAKRTSISSASGAASVAIIPVPGRLPKQGRKGQQSAHNPELAKSYPLNFLLCEDNIIIRKIAVSSLKKLGYSDDNITVAVDGVEAINRYEASLSTPDQPRFTAIIMDIWMPRIDGYEASRRIQQLAHEHGETTTIMAVTADVAESAVERARDAGIQGFLGKPYMLIDLERLIINNFPNMRI